MHYQNDSRSSWGYLTKGMNMGYNVMPPPVPLCLSYLEVLVSQGDTLLHLNIGFVRYITGPKILTLKS